MGDFNNGPRRGFNSNGPRRNFNNNGGFRRDFGNNGGRGNFGPREMHKATCTECGQECEVPFKPTQGKPVFCRECFRNKRKF